MFDEYKNTKSMKCKHLINLIKTLKTEYQNTKLINVNTKPTYKSTQ